ncbi:autoinducer binding domain-containing protein [Aeromonas dhakensis]|uniref:autoinducer binding domain-containing protein n=2 Tax=Aeromonas dhakensis TaxID=196024 RepID=UPI001BCF4A0E|nr:autoinducer binding domain-containing protein [Aeromonas dhakensis]MBS4718222.1 autoinducer binding domain-containing protein [Aeromonas dhakensis]
MLLRISGKSMFNWQEDLLNSLGDLTLSKAEVLDKIDNACKALGFEYYAYGQRQPLPLTKPKIIMINNYSNAWQQRYQSRNYLSFDPSIQACITGKGPIVWSHDLFKAAPEIWEEAQVHGLRVGWAQGIMDRSGYVGMLTLARSTDPLLPAELDAKQMQLRWLSQLIHLLLSPFLSLSEMEARLTEREAEVLRWTAEGKTSADISTILQISDNTVNFHIKNALNKLGSSNKTAATVKAALLGYLA